MPQYEVSVPGKGTFSVNSPTDLTDQQVWAAVQQQLSIPEPPPPPPLPERGLASIAFDALKRGGYQTGMLLGDILPAMVGRAVGADEYANRQLAEAKATQEKIEKEMPQAVPSYTNISGVGDAVKYVVEAVGENLVSILPSIFTGGAATVLTAGARAAAIKAAEKKAVEEVTKAAAKNVLTKETLDGIGQAALDVGVKEAQKIALRAQVGGAFAGSAVQNIPEVYQNILEETGKESLGASLLFGGLNSALDTITPMLLLRKMSKAGISPQEVGMAWYKRFGKGLAEGFASEGLTETAQEMSSAAAEKFVDENKEFFTRKNLERFINAGLKGGLGGGIITGTTEVATGKGVEKTPKTSEQDEIFRRQQELLELVQQDKELSAQEQEAQKAEIEKQKAEALKFKPTAQNDLMDMTPERLYKHVEGLRSRPQTPEVVEELRNASEILGAKELEEIRRRTSPNVVTQATLGAYKIPRNSNLYNELVGKNLSSGEDRDSIRTTINIYRGMIEGGQAPKALLPKIDRLQADLDKFEANLPYGRGAYVERTVDETVGAGAPVAEQPSAGAPAEGAGVTQPSGVAPAVAPAGESSAGETAAPAPVAPAPQPVAETPAIAPSFKIVKTEVAKDESGKTQNAWNVVDAKDGRIFDTFNTRKEAQTWVNDAKQKASSVQTPTPSAAPSAAPKAGEVLSIPKTDRDAVEQHAVKGYPIVEAPVDQITLSKDVPQFKSDADTRGLVRPLEGKFERIGVAPIQLWKRADGRLEVISGRHRFDLAQRSGETTIPAQIHEESAGFTPAMAATLDAELNIRDEQGEVKDYVVYFEKSGISQQEAKSRGLLGRTVGQRGWSIASQGSPDLIAAHRAGIVPDDAAAGISSLAPGDARLQALGIREIQKDKSTPAVLNTIQAYKTITADRAPVDTGGDLFGFDDSALKEAEDMARIATDKQREISSRLSAITGAAKKPEVAKKEGIDIRDEKALNKRIEELRKTKAAWNNWANSPELVNEIRAEMQPKEEPKGKPSLAERPEEEVDQEEATEKQPEEKAPSKEERRAVIEQKMAELEALLKKSLSKFGLKDVGFKLSTDLKASGLYAENLITLALDASNPIQDLRHEAIHALKALGFFSDSQWDALVREAKGKWINKFLKERNINKGLLQEGQKSRYDAYIEYYTEQGLSEAEIEQNILEEAISDAFAEFDSTKPPPGLMQAILKRLRNFFSGVKDAANEAGFTEAEQIFGKVERGELTAPNSWRETSADRSEARTYEEETGIRPYTSEGQIDVSVDVPRPSIKAPYSEAKIKKALEKDNKVLENHPILGVPLNANGTVTLYFPTTNEMAREVARTKRLRAFSSKANRIYLTNESSPSVVRANPGSIDQGEIQANVMVQVPPEMLHFDMENNGRKDFFIQVAEGNAFAEKMKSTKLFTLFKPRSEAISKTTTITDIADGFDKSIADFRALTPAKQKERLKQARDVLKSEHNVGTLLGENGKLQKTRLNEYQLPEDIKHSVASMGLGLASAQKINEKNLSTCPKAARCEGLCLGETSGQNQLYGGEGPFRAGPRLSQYLKTEAMVMHPEDFAIVLYDEIKRFESWAKKETGFESTKDENGQNIKVEKQVYTPAIRLNVTSDFPPKVFRSLIESFPGVRFYDYTKLTSSDSIAPNHHLTYSSDGVAQVIDGKTVGTDSNWRSVLKRLNDGFNVAMAFSSRRDMPSYVVDEKSGKRFQVWNGDNYDARFLDPKPGTAGNEFDTGMIVGLTNKDRTGDPEDSALRHDGFFVDYNRERDGDTVIVRDQDKIKSGKKIISIGAAKPSLREEGERPTKQNVLGAMKMAQEKQPYMNCQLCVQMATGVVRLRDLPKVTKAQIGDIYTFGETKDMAAHYAIEVGDGKVAEVEEWGEKVREIPLQSVVDEYGEPSSIRRPPEDAYTRSVVRASLRAPETEAFKRWFGDSKVVDAEGKPLALYRGVHGFESISEKALNAEAREGYATFASNNPAISSTYANPNWGRFGDERETGALVPVYVKADRIIEFPTQTNSGGWRTFDKFEFDRRAKTLRAGEVLVVRGVTDTGPRSNLDVDPERGWSYPSDIYAWRPGTSVKSAIGNIGTYDITKPDIRASLRAPETKEFKNWFGDSKIVNPDGSPKVMYHGTGKDYKIFTTERRQAKAIFVADDPDFAEKFAKDTFARAAAEAAKGVGVSDSEYKAGVNKAIEAIRKDYGSRPEGKEMIAGVRAGYNDANAEAQEYMRDAFKNIVSTGPNIMPVYVRAENPFDYDNPDHAKAVADKVMQNEGFAEEDRRGLESGISKGSWDIIEESYVQSAIRQLGFDGFYVKENGIKNLAVYNSDQIKSATGNVGAYGQRPITKEEADRLGMSEEEASAAQKKGDIRFSLRDVPAASGVAYHAGNLGYGSDTTLGRMTGGRGTGHFGTGVYFVGSEDKAKSLAKTYDRPIQKISLEGFKLARPGSVGAQQLHDGLKIVNNLVGGEPNTEDESKKIYDAAFKIWVSGIGRGASQEDIQKIIRQALTETRPLYDDLYAKSTYVDSASTRVMKSLGYEGIDVRGLKNFDNTEFGTVVYTKIFEERPQVKPSTTGRASLRDTTSPAVRARISQVTTARDEKTFVQRITDAIAPTARSKFRAAFINRYNRLSEYDKKRAEMMGGVALMADSSAESAALMSDNAAGITASVLGVHNKKGGIPVYRNGFTTVLSTVEGPVSIFAPLAKYNDPYIYQKYQFWAAVSRGIRLYQEGRERSITPADQRLAAEILRDHPEFVDIQKKWIKFNNGLVKYLVDTGVLSQARANEFMKYSDYIPFYRQIEGDENAIGPKLFQSIAGVKPPKKLKGSEAPLGEFLETIVMNVQSSIQAGVKNVASQRAAKVAMDIGMAKRLNHVASGLDVFKVLENGKEVYYRSADPLFIDAIKSLNMGEIPFMGFLSAPANLLRNLVTKDPGFILANMMRDSMAAWTTSGVKMTPIASTISNFGKAIAGQSPELEALLNAGILGGYEYSKGVKISSQKFERELRRKGGKMTIPEMAASPFTYVWEGLEKATQASDAATRIEIYKKTLAQTGNEAEALYRAMEVMNFNRKGSSAIVRVLTAAVPFLNARIQGLDVLYRAAFGQVASADAASIQKAFFVRGMTMAALSCMYWLLTHDDEEYKKQEQETRDNYWLIPSLGVRIPIPFEVGVIFKVIPERIMAMTLGDDTGRDFARSMGRQLASTLAFNPIPQTVLPLVESTVNFSFFTMRPIVDKGLEDVAPFAQVSPRTSRLSENVGKMLKNFPTEFQISPVKLDQLINGYTGTLGMYMVDAIDAIYDMHTDSPKASKRFEQLPVIKRFVMDPDARGQVTAYYELKNKVDEVVRTSNLMERTMDYAAWGEYYKDNAKLLASKDYVLDLEKTMKEFREMKTMIRSSNMSADAKRDAILNITRMENALTTNMQHLKKMLSR